MLNVMFSLFSSFDIEVVYSIDVPGICMLCYYGR